MVVSVRFELTLADFTSQWS